MKVGVKLYGEMEPFKLVVDIDLIIAGNCKGVYIFR